MVLDRVFLQNGSTRRVVRECLTANSQFCVGSAPVDSGGSYFSPVLRDCPPRYLLKQPVLMTVHNLYLASPD